MEKENKLSSGGAKAFTNILLYGGISKYEYEDIRPIIDKSNGILVRVVSGIATMLILLLYMLSKHSIGLGMNQLCYQVGIMISLIVLCLSIVSIKYQYLIMPLVHISYVFYYTFGILIGIIIDTDGKTVLFMAMLVFLPTLFTAPPIQTLTITGICTLTFLYLCFKTKTGTLLEKEVFNALFFSMLGSISGVVITYMKISSFISAEKLKEVSRKDRLTNMNNRNAYELDKYTIPNFVKTSLTCIFVDVNGLKTVNDTKGHKEGDKMLKIISELILKYFDENFSYRLGGDEFVIYIPDIKKKPLLQLIDRLSSDVEEHSYHVAIGYAQHAVKGLSLTDLEKEAEAMMYKNKSEFYKNSEFERRHH